MSIIIIMVKKYILIVKKIAGDKMKDEKMEILDFEQVKTEVKKTDTFMKKIYISLIILVVLGLLIYFFGYNIFRPFIKV